MRVWGSVRIKRLLLGNHKIGQENDETVKPKQKHKRNDHFSNAFVSNIPKQK